MKQLNSFLRNKTDCIILTLLSVYTYVAILDDTLLRLTSVIFFLRWGVSIAGLFLFLYRNKWIPPVKKLIFSAVVLVAFSIAARATGRTYLILYAVLIIAVEGVDPRRVVKAWLLSTVLALVTILILCWTRVLTDQVYQYASGRSCHCLGFSYYSSFPFLVFYCSVAYVYLKGDQVRFLDYGLVAAVNLLMYYLTTLQLTFFLTFIFIALDALLVKVVKLILNRKPIWVLSALLFPLGVFTTFFVMVKYNPDSTVWTMLNSALHNRPMMAHRGYLRHSLSLFGNRISMVGNSAVRQMAPGTYFYIDSGFAYALLGYGLIFTCVVIVLYSVMYVYSCRKNDRHLFTWLTCVLLFTMLNNTWVDVYYNPVLLISFAAYMGTKINQKHLQVRLALIPAECVGLTALAVWLTPWFKALGDPLVGGNPRTALLAAAALGLLLLGLVVLLERVLEKVFLRQRPGKRELVCAGTLMLCCALGALTLNRQVDRLTAKNAEGLEVERTAVEAVRQGNCRLLVDSSEELYRRMFGGVGRSPYYGNDLAESQNVAYITAVENNFSALIERGFLYTEISDEHAIYTNSPAAAAALQTAGYHLTGYYSYNIAEVPPVDVHFFCDISGRRIREECYDSAGNPVTYPDGAHAREYTYDKAGYIASICFFDTDWEPVTCIDGYSVEQRKYDTGGNLISCNFLDAEGRPVNASQGYAEVRRVYDAKNQLVREEYFSAEGTPALRTAGYSAWEQEYDGEGNLVVRRYLGADGQPIMRADGFSEVRWVRAADSAVRNLELRDLSGRGVPLDGINLAVDIEGDGWSRLMEPQYNKKNSTFDIGWMNLGEKTAGDEYTCQVEIEFIGASATEERSFRFWAQGEQDGKWEAENVWNSGLVNLMEVPEDGVYRFVLVSSLSESSESVGTFNIGFRCDNWASGAFRVRNVKIEKGAEATEWTPGI